MNKDLYNKKIKVPDEIREHMRNSFRGWDKSTGIFAAILNYFFH